MNGGLSSVRINYKGFVKTVIETSLKKRTRSEGVLTVRIDREDKKRVYQFKWSSQGRYLRIVRTWDGKQHNVYLHHFLIGRSLDRTLEIDHINRDPLDNRKCNLRFVSRRENMQNRKETAGVYWDKDRTKWVAQNARLEKVYIGSFFSRREACSAYKKSRRKKNERK